MGLNELKRDKKWWLAGGCLVALLAGGAGVYLTRGTGSAVNAHEAALVAERPTGIRVEVLHPRKGLMERTTTQPGSVHAYESVQLYAGVSGYLKNQAVDIGDRIKRGQILATVDVPELEKQVQRFAAIVEQAGARVEQMQARAESARAEWEAAKAAVPRAEAMLKSKTAELRYRQLQLQRMRDLAKGNNIEERLVDESQAQRDAVREAELAAQESVTSARATVKAMEAKIKAADADVAESRAEVKVAQAELEKTQAIVKFATIVAPFDGVVTLRNFFVGDFVRSASEGTHLPLLTVQRTDRMRVVVQIPDRDVPYADPGDAAVVEIDALPDEKFAAKVSRVSQSEDAGTRLMHVEIDLPNTTGKIRNGMYGRVTIILDKSDLLAIPCSCLVGKPQEGKGSVYVVRDGFARLTPIRISGDNGLQVGILSGLKADDEIIAHPSSAIADGTAVTVETAEARRRSAPGH